MNKTQMRSGAAGLLAATLVLTPFLLSTDENGEAEASDEVALQMNKDSVEEFLREEGLTAIETAEYNELHNRITVLEGAREKLEELENESGNEDSDNEDEQNDANGSGATGNDETGSQDAFASDNSETVYQMYLVISSGMSSGEIAIILEETNIIDDAAEFRQYIEDNDLVMSIKAGQFLLDSSMSIAEIADIIT